MAQTLRTQRQGFTAIEGLLIGLGIAILGFTGWFVWQASNNASASLDIAASAKTANQTYPHSSTGCEDGTKDTEEWLTYRANGGEFTLCLADGWKLERYLKSPALYTFSNDTLKPIPGTRAIVKEVSAGKDGNGIGLSISYSQASDMSKPTGTAQLSFQTIEGLEVKVGKNIQTKISQDGIGGLPLGATEYSFVITSKTGSVVYATYAFEKGMPDYHSTVEQVIKTVRIL